MKKKCEELQHTSATHTAYIFSGENSQYIMAYYQQPNHNRQPSYAKSPSHSRQQSIATLCEQLELNLSLRNIPKMDLMSPSDPFIVVKMKDEVRNRWNEVGKTDIIWDNPNPDFSKDIRINYMFEEIQTVRLDIWDANEKQTKDLSKSVSTPIYIPQNHVTYHLSLHSIHAIVHVPICNILLYTDTIILVT